MANYEHTRVDEPSLSKLTASIATPVFRLFDRLFHSKWNPLYRSGTIAILMFLILVVTGVYLLCFYKVGSPYSSIQSIHNDIFLGKWIRTLHRYATDIGIVAILFHFLQIALQGKTWGPRTLAWVSGVIMLVLFYITAWTGYVMVWDSHGQLLAEAGAKLLLALPLIAEPVTQAFSGAKPLPDAFFFMNLFMHVAVPLLFVIGLWIHTARIKRTQWLPPKSIRYSLLGILGIVCIIFPAPLLPAADLLRTHGKIPIDIFLSYWLPALEIIDAGILLYGGLALFLIAVSASWWWKPAITLVGRQSVVDEELCTGCTQCAIDCPYEAITMIPHGNRKRLLAAVSETNCVSCGICSASCSDFAIGPPGRSGTDQSEAARILKEKIASSPPVDTIIAYCTNNPGINSSISNLQSKVSKRLDYFPLQCAGTLHNQTLTELMQSASHVLVWGCSERVCMNRDGIVLLRGRFERTRVPFLDKYLDRSHATLETKSSWEMSEIVESINESKSVPTAPSKAHGALAFIFAVIFILAIAAASQFPFGNPPRESILLVAGALPAVVKQHCRPLTDSEKQNLPAHMQRKEVCEERHSSYVLSIFIDGKEMSKERVSPGGLRGDRPVYLNAQLKLMPGSYNVEVLLKPDQEDARETTFLFKENLSLVTEKNTLLIPQIESRSFKIIQ